MPSSAAALQPRAATVACRAAAACPTHQVNRVRGHALAEHLGPRVRLDLGELELGVVGVHGVDLLARGRAQHLQSAPGCGLREWKGKRGGRGQETQEHHAPLSLRFSCNTRYHCAQLLLLLCCAAADAAAANACTHATTFAAGAAPVAARARPTTETSAPEPPHTFPSHAPPPCHPKPPL